MSNMNIQPAEHIKTITEYYFSVKLAEVAQMNAEGKDVISLAVGAPTECLQMKQLKLFVKQ